MAALKIAFLSSQPLDDRRHWSGTMFKMYEALQEQGFEIIWVPTATFSAAEEKVFSFVQKTYERVFRRRFNTHHFMLKAFLASKKTEKALQKTDFDLLFSPTYLNEIAFLKTDKPIIYLNDGTFNKLIGYNPGFMGLGWLSKKITRLLEEKALENSTHLIFSSEWAADDAHKTYGIPTEKISVVKFGANLGVPEVPLHEKNYSEPLNVLFSGVGWERKGGDIALEAIKILQGKGYSLKFKIMGCTPEVDEDFVEIIPFLNKNKPEELAEIERHLAEAHLMFVPTRTDCSPIAFCEAAGFSIPVLSTDTGGVSSIVEDGKTGFLLPENASAKDYADLIEREILSHPDRLKQISENARRKYDEQLNWKVWGDRMQSIFTGISEKYTQIIP